MNETIVTYSLGDPFVGQMTCSQCGAVTPAWRSSGMSACEPHFYCNRCSNAVVMESCKEFIWCEERKLDETLLLKITERLPSCHCGGRFQAGANPKCKYCNHEFSHQNTAIQRLTDPHVILVNGAAMCDESGEIKYTVKINGA